MFSSPGSHPPSVSGVSMLVVNFEEVKPKGDQVIRRESYGLCSCSVSSSDPFFFVSAITIPYSVNSEPEKSQHLLCCAVPFNLDLFSL